MSRRAHAALGLDIGGTKLHAVLLRPDGTVAGRATAPTPAGEGPAAVLDALAALGRILGEIPAAVGVGSAGNVDVETGTVVSATDALHGWVGTDLRGGVAARLGVVAPVTVLNDVDAFAVAESTCGVAAGEPDVLAVMVGTGIGGAVVSGGRLLIGSHAAGGDLGHVPAALADGLPCGCGGTGHVESVASGAGMLATYRRAGGSATDLREVSRRAADGEPQAGAVLVGGAAALGRAVAAAVTLLDPAVVVLGGGALGVGTWFVDAVRTSLDAAVPPALAPVDVRTSLLGPDAVAVGAALAATRLSPPDGPRPGGSPGAALVGSTGAAVGRA